MLASCDLTVSNIRILTAVNDLAGKVWNPMIRWTQKHAVFIELTTHNGLTGTGECWCFDNAPDALVAYLRTEVLAPMVGCTVGEIRERLDALLLRATLTARHGMLASASSGVDIALWDLCARQRGLPLWKLLNPAANGRVQLYASGGLYGEEKTNDDLAAELKGLVDGGFTAVKMKVGGLTIDEDVARVGHVRKAIGDRAALIVDGVYAFDLESAKRFFDKIHPCTISAFQSPVDARRIEHMVELRQAGVPVMGVEAEYRQEILQSYIDRGAVKILQVAPIACGGISSVLQLANQAQSAGINLSPEVSSTALATMVACHLAAAHQSIVDVEYHTVHQLFFDRLPFSPADLKDGTIDLTQAPGIGITLPPELVCEQINLAD